MKKLIKFTTLVLGLLLMISSLTACSFLFGGSSDNSSKNDNPPKEEKKQAITVYNGDTPVNYNLVIGEIGQIDVFAKPGYYFIGAYDSQNGGVRYFDESGQSTLSWSEGNPTTFYARFSSIYNLTFTQILRDEEPLTWSDGEKWFTFEMNDNLKNAINANLGEKLSVKISFEAIHDKGWGLEDTYVTNLKSGGEKFFIIEEETFLKSSAYTTFYKEFKINAKLLKSGKIYLCVDTPLIVVASKYSVKNIQIEMSFIEN